MGKRREEARRWFQQAHYDLKAAEWNFEGGFYNTVCFLSQQSAEKALKSILYYLGSRRKALLTHSLVEMVQEGAKVLKEVGELLDQARLLDMHYIPSRYPNGLPSGYPHQFYGKKIAEEALEATSKVRTFVTKYYESQGENEIMEPD